MKLLISPLIGRRVPVACLAIFVLALGLSACGSSSSSSSSSADPSASTAATARLNLAKCFRAHGLNVPDPSSGAGAAGGGSLFRALRNYSQAQVTKARQACQPVLRAGVPAREHQSPAARPAPAAARQVRPVHALARRQRPRPHLQQQRSWGRAGRRIRVPRRLQLRPAQQSGVPGRGQGLPEPASAVRPRWDGRCRQDARAAACSARLARSPPSPSRSGSSSPRA